MLTEYANQSLVWQRITGTNDANEHTYSTSTIQGRKETGFKLIRNAQGEQVVSTAYVATATAVQVNDLIDGHLIISAEPAIDLDGAVLFYEVYLQ